MVTMMVHSQTAVNQDAQEYLKQFNPARQNGGHRQSPGAAFEAMLDNWTREKFQAPKSRKGPSHDGRGWHDVNPILTQYDTTSQAGVSTEGALFAQAELQDEQETYMNEEVLLEQLLRDEPVKKGKKGKSHKPKNDKKHKQPLHSTPKASTSHDPEYNHLDISTMLPTTHNSKRSNPPPPPPAREIPGSADNQLPPCHNCGWTYTITTDNEVLDLPELLDILTPKTERKYAELPNSYLSDNDVIPPPLPSKPRPPPPKIKGQNSESDFLHLPLDQRLNTQENHNINVHANCHDHHKDNSHLPLLNMQENLYPQNGYNNDVDHQRDNQYAHNPLAEVRNGADGIGNHVADHYIEKERRKTFGNNINSLSSRVAKHPTKSPISSPQHSPRSRPMLKTNTLITQGTQTDFPDSYKENGGYHNGRSEKGSEESGSQKSHSESAFTRSKPPSGRKAMTGSMDSLEDIGQGELAPILDAAKRGDLNRMVQLIHEDPEQLKLRDVRGNNLTHICCERGHLDSLKYLYENFTYQSEEENKSKFTPAVLAVKAGQSEILDWLLERTGARDEILPLPNKKSLLHHAAKFGQDGCLRIVLEKLSGMGRLTACSDSNGNSPAHVAAKHGHLTCLQTLVEYGMDVTKANKYGHSPCYYADFSNHRQCAGYLMVVETCLNLAKKLIRLERSMEQLSSSLAKYSGEGEIAGAYDYSGDKSSATSSVEDDGTRDEAWLLLCRKFEEASKRLVVFRTQNRAFRPLKPTKLAMLALAQSKEDSQAAISVLSASKSLNNSLDGINTDLVETRSKSVPDLINVHSENKIEESDNRRSSLLQSEPYFDSKFDAQFRQSEDKLLNLPRLSSTHEEDDLSASKLLSPTLSSPRSRDTFFQAEHHIKIGIEQGARPKTSAFRMSNQFQESEDISELKKKSVDITGDQFHNDLDYHLQTRVFTSKTSSFRPEKYLIHNNHAPQNSALEIEPSPQRDIPPPPPLDNETSDFFEDGRHDSDGSELDEETLRKIFEMQNEILRCQPNLGEPPVRTKIKTPVKLKLTDAEFKESYARGDDGEVVQDGAMAMEPIKRYRDKIFGIWNSDRFSTQRSSANRNNSQVHVQTANTNQNTQESYSDLQTDIQHERNHHNLLHSYHSATHAMHSNDAMDEFNKSGNNSLHGESEEDIPSRNAKDDHLIPQRGYEDVPFSLENRDTVPSNTRPWYEISDDYPEEYFTLL